MKKGQYENVFQNFAILLQNFNSRKHIFAKNCNIVNLKLHRIYIINYINWEIPSDTQWLREHDQK